MPWPDLNAIDRAAEARDALAEYRRRHPEIAAVWPRERCPFCGAYVESPCDAPAPDVCERAIDTTR